MTLDPSFRVQELSFAVSQIAQSIELTTLAERRGWWDRLLGHQPEGVGGALASARERAAAHFERHSVWLHNSVRGAVALGLAALVANLSGAQHSFWVIFGTLSVLRSNALKYGPVHVPGVVGTVIGFAIGPGCSRPSGSDTTLLWSPAHRGADRGRLVRRWPAARVTVTLLILFNIIQLRAGTSGSSGSRTSCSALP